MWNIMLYYISRIILGKLCTVTILIYIIYHRLQYWWNLIFYSNIVMSLRLYRKKERENFTEIAVGTTIMKGWMMNERGDEWRESLVGLVNCFIETYLFVHSSKFVNSYKTPSNSIGLFVIVIIFELKHK